MILMPYSSVFFLMVTPQYRKRQRCSSVANVRLHTARGGFVRTCGMGIAIGNGLASANTAVDHPVFRGQMNVRPPFGLFFFSFFFALSSPV